MEIKIQKQQLRVIPQYFIWPFILLTLCFALWGFANDITNPMVKAFSKIMMMSNFQGSLVQFAFYGGYFVMAFPAALFIKKFSYKSGILVGLGLYATGALLFIPASLSMTFGIFLIAYFILTCGLSFLETTANPYILSMGSEETATRRLNLAQAFNPIGSLMGMFTAQQMILAKLNSATAIERTKMTAETLKEITSNDLTILRTPYVYIAFLIMAIFLIVLFTRMPGRRDKDKKLEIAASLKRLFTNKRYIHGVITQFFYVGAQIMCWTFTIHYGTEIFTSENFGMSVQDAEVLSSKYNIIAMILFCCSRFICTFLLKYISPGKLLKNLAFGGIILSICTILVPGITGLYCLVGISACMSLMFPTIYGISLRGLGDDAKLGAAGLIMAILGGSVLPPLQGAIIDSGGFLFLSGIRFSYVITLICFVVIAHFGLKTYKSYLT